MCTEKDCGVFRVYTTTAHTAQTWWLQSDGSGTNGTTPPADGSKVYRVHPDRADHAEFRDKFSQGLRRDWDNTPLHIGPDCASGCRCVRTEEKVGEPSVPEVLNWSQPTTITGSAGPVAVVVHGTFSKTFQDYKAKCDRIREVGEPISYEPYDDGSRRQQQQQRRI